MSRNSVLAAFGMALALAYFVLVHECTYGAGMGAVYRTCDCRGVEWQLYDRRAADGPQKTLCIGIVSSRTCYASWGGLKIDCDDPRMKR